MAATIREGFLLPKGTLVSERWSPEGGMLSGGILVGIATF
jgi:hypothetical protein